MMLATGTECGRSVVGGSSALDETDAEAVVDWPLAREVIEPVLLDAALPCG